MARGVAHELIFHWEKLSEHRESMCLSPVFSNFLSKIDNIWNYYSFTLVLWTTNTMLDVQVSWCIVNAFTQLWYSCIYLIRSFQKLRNMFQVVIFTLLFPPMLNNYGNWCSPTMWQHDSSLMSIQAANKHCSEKNTNFYITCIKSLCMFQFSYAWCWCYGPFRIYVNPTKIVANTNT